MDDLRSRMRRLGGKARYIRWARSTLRAAGLSTNPPVHKDDMGLAEALLADVEEVSAASVWQSPGPPNAPESPAHQRVFTITELREAILGIVASTPSWIWFKFEGTDMTENRNPLTLRRKVPHRWGNSTSEGEDWDGPSSPPNLTENLQRAVIIHNCTAEFTNRETQASRKTSESPALRKGLSTSRYTEWMRWFTNMNMEVLDRIPGPQGPSERKVEALIKEIVATQNLPEGDKSFRMEIGRLLRSPPVRRQVDWFFLDGYLQAWTRSAMCSVPFMPWCSDLRSIRVCVLRLVDVYQGIRYIFQNFEGQEESQENLLYELDDVNDILVTPGSDFGRQKRFLKSLAKLFLHLFHETSDLEELKVLVDEVPGEPSPSQFEEVQANWCNGQRGTFSGYSITTNPDTQTTEDKRMMALVKRVLDNLVEIHEPFCFNFLQKTQAQPWLLGRDSDENVFSKWLMSRLGRKWLTTGDGLAWLQTYQGRWWLSQTRYGNNWLEREEGLRWLQSENSELFRKSKFALAWARWKMDDPKYNTNYKSDGPGKVPTKAWYATTEGGEWFRNNCKDGGPPGKPDLGEPPHSIDLPAPRPNATRVFEMSSPIRWSFIQKKNIDSTASPESSSSAKGTMRKEGKGKEKA
ncbi:hypothetical protein F5Y19DRAFT_209297 [Xylariaceae sp. FL1651]|nr:hypothetical protein F5Y19DRAFT_209297 [Xylariaceae sp. FL1651]